MGEHIHSLRSLAVSHGIGGTEFIMRVYSLLCSSVYSSSSSEVLNKNGLLIK